jgi:hypothetical protein
MRKFYLLGMAAVVAVLSGCGATNSTTFRSMSAAYREVVESYSNDNTLINVVRASQKMPVSFLDIPSIMGTGNVSANASLTGTANSLSTRVDGQRWIYVYPVVSRQCDLYEAFFVGDTA